MATMWTAEEAEAAISLWKAGILSAREIGAVIGKTRNSIIGYMHRYQIERDGPAPKPKKAFGPPKPRAPRKSRAKGKSAPPPPLPPGEKPAPAHGIAMIDLREHHCRWPLGKGLDLPKFYCGQAKLSGRSYCPVHCKLAYTALRPGRLFSEKKAQAA